MNIKPALQIKSWSKSSNSLQLEESQTRTFSDEMNRFNLFAGIGVAWPLQLFQQRMHLAGFVNYGLLRIPRKGEFDVTENVTREYFEWRVCEVALELGYHF